MIFGEIHFVKMKMVVIMPLHFANAKQILDFCAAPLLFEREGTIIVPHLLSTIYSILHDKQKGLRANSSPDLKQNKMDVKMSFVFSVLAEEFIYCSGIIIYNNKE